jgi:hypothetical protein
MLSLVEATATVSVCKAVRENAQLAKVEKLVAQGRVLLVVLKHALEAA